ncbi:MAG TPA: hypothetical protein VNA25_25895 [Phycisphaerae bacterium]|nr:hypothetical protein [Phycisphaerae bacterium]
MPDTEPLRLQIVERVIEVLEAMRPDDDYYYKAGEVNKRFLHWEDCQAFPSYSVFLDSGGALEDHANFRFGETFYINVKCYVKDDKDTVTPLARCLSDVRHAVINDTKSDAGTGSLGVLGALVFIEEGATTDNGYLSLDGYGFFEQRFKVEISDTF